jgi:hypothetical protein
MGFYARGCGVISGDLLGVSEGRDICMLSKMYEQQVGRLRFPKPGVQAYISIE